MNPEAAAIARRIQAGDRRAESEMAIRYGPGVAAILRRAAGERALADDLYQEVFRLTIEKLRAGALREPDKLPGFICQLARNLAIGHFRRERRRKDNADVDELVVPDPGPSPLDQLLLGEKAALVRQVLDELTTDRDRELLRRFYLDGDDKDQVCRQLGLSAVHFNRVLFRARERYRELFLDKLAQRRDAGGIPDGVDGT